MTLHRSNALPLLIAVALCASVPADAVLARTKVPPPPPPPAMDISPGPLSQPAPEPEEPVNDAQVSATIMPGSPPVRPTVTPARSAAGGDVSLNFPQADVRDVAQAVLGDVLGLNYLVDQSVDGTISLVTTHAVARRDVLGLFEDALKASNMVLVHRGKVFVISTLSSAKTDAPTLDPASTGYGNETIHLKFISASELKKLLDPIVPGAISRIDEAQNTLVVTGTTTQRKSIHDLVGQFDVNWLKGMSFGLFVPQRTDSRLITPELEKLLNGEGAPTKGLVRLISMERLNGILAISSQPQYLDDVRHWIEVLDREGESAERKLFVYRVQNGRSSDLARTLVTGFGGTATGGSTQVASNTTGVTPPGQPSPVTGFQGTGASPSSGSSISAFGSGGTTGASSSGSTFGQQGTQGQSAPTSGSVNLQLGGPAGNVSISSDEANNAIVVFATPREYAVVEDALRKLDVLPLQVLIEAAITEVTLNDELKYGVQWYLQSANSSFGNSNGTRLQNFKPVLPGFNFAYSNGSGSIQAALDALSAVTHIEVISAPKLLVLNNQTASLEVGDQVPVSTGSAVSTVSGDAPIVNSIEYRDTGVILTVTPRVNAGGLVLLDISQEVSDVAQTATSNIDSPTIQQRKFSSSIAVQDGQTVALGGLIRDTRETVRNGLPLLSKIPVIGGAFGTHDNTHKRTELLVLLTPRVIRNPDDAKAITDELMRKIQTVQPISTVKDKTK